MHAAIRILYFLKRKGNDTSLRQINIHSTNYDSDSDIMDALLFNKKFQA